MIPRFSHSIQRENTEFFVTTDGVTGTLLEIDITDLESKNPEATCLTMSTWLKSLPSSLLVRIIRTIKPCHSITVDSSRAEAISELGFSEHDVAISIESLGRSGIIRDFKLALGMRTAPLETQGSEILDAIKSLDQFGLQFKPLSIEKMKPYFFWTRHEAYRLCSSYLDTGRTCIGSLRLKKQKALTISLDDAYSSISDLEFPLELRTSIRRIEPVKRELMLKLNLKHAEAGNDLISELQTEKLGHTAASTALEGTDLFEFEMTVILQANSEGALKERLSAVQGAIESFGEVSIETYGCLQTIAASEFGSNQHVPLLETEFGICGYIPIFSHGGSQSTPSKSSLLIHRKNGGLIGVDLLSENSINSNAVVIGKSGRGKSVFTGLLAESLLNDPDVRLLMVDVGGSHSNECELLGGREFAFSLDQPSGLSPLTFGNQFASGEARRAILGRFIESLVLRDNERFVPKEVRTEIDLLLQNFFDSNFLDLGLAGLSKLDNGFSRRDLLRRWSGSGLYAKAFQSLDQNDSSACRLRYFNFSHIFQASDPEFATAGMAAVLAQFNLEVLTNPDKRIVLVCDETPFFVESCFEFFKFSMANVRKFGAAVILVVQLSQHLVKDGDTGLIDNAEHRFYFSKDGSSRDFQDRTSLSHEEIARLEALTSAPGVLSEALYQTSTGCRTLVLKLTPQELMRVGSSQKLRLKLEKLRLAFPELNLKEALECFARFA